MAVTCNPPLPIYVNEDVLNDVLENSCRERHDPQAGTPRSLQNSLLLSSRDLQEYAF